MLFTDRDICTVDELDNFEPGIAKVITTEALPVTGETGILRLTAGECFEEILAAMQTYDSFPSDGQVSSNHISAVLNVYGTRNTPRIHITQICLNSKVAGTPSALKLWVMYATLANLYRAAWNRKLKEDKYSEKQRLFKREAARAFGTVQALGLPIVWNPLPAPAAALEANSGSWSASNVATVTGAGLATGLKSVQITWVDESSYRNGGDKGNAESHPTEAVNVSLEAGQLIQVDITSLNPPAGFDFQNKGFGQGIYFPRSASGWNVYIGGILQNSSPIPVATKSYTLASDPQTIGYRVGSGQYADVYNVMPSGIPVYRG